MSEPAAACATQAEDSKAGTLDTLLAAVEQVKEEPNAPEDKDMGACELTVSMDMLPFPHLLSPAYLHGESVR